MKARSPGKLYGSGLIHVCKYWDVFYRRRHHSQPWEIHDIQLGVGQPVHLAQYRLDMKVLYVKEYTDVQKQVTSEWLADLTGMEELPRLRAHFSDTVLEKADGRYERPPGTLWIQPRGKCFQCILKEPAQSLLLRVEVQSLLTLWTELEAALSPGASLWQHDEFAKKLKLKKLT